MDNISDLQNWNPSKGAKGSEPISSGELADGSEITYEQAGVEGIDILRINMNGDGKEIKCRIKMTQYGTLVLGSGQIAGGMIEYETEIDFEGGQTTEYYFKFYDSEPVEVGFDFDIQVTRKSDGKRAKYKYSRAGR
jgi:hypothetical protein